jgi:hypothetical protein
MQKLMAVARVGKRWGSLLALCLVLLGVMRCGGGSAPIASGGPLAGNWQLNLKQEFPRPPSTNAVSASGFLSQTGSTVTGSVQVPPSPQNNKCAGVGTVTGTVSGQNTTLVINNGGTELNLIGTLSSDEKSMTGSYTGPGGGCFTTPTSGTWTASLIPPLSGNFTGTITGSNYMSILTGTNTGNVAPIPVSGTLMQVGGPGSSNATLTGTISATGYPCFTNATFTGTISGANVYLLVFGFNSQQIGTVGVPPTTSSTGTPATVVVDQNSVSLVGSTYALGQPNGPGGNPFGPCPPITNPAGGASVPNDSATITLTLSSASNFEAQQPK